MNNGPAVVYVSAIMSQSQISRSLRGESARSRIVAILSKERFDSRRALGRRICEEFSFVDALGRLQVGGCLKALTTLAEGLPDIVLPTPRAIAVDNKYEVDALGEEARCGSRRCGLACRPGGLGSVKCCGLAMRCFGELSLAMLRTWVLAPDDGCEPRRWARLELPCITHATPCHAGCARVLGREHAGKQSRQGLQSSGVSPGNALSREAFHGGSAGRAPQGSGGAGAAIELPLCRQRAGRGNPGSEWCRKLQGMQLRIKPNIMSFNTGLEPSILTPWKTP